MRRYLPTLLLLLVLLAIGGYAVGNAFRQGPVERGGYVPTLSADPQAAQFQALILIVGLALGFGGLVSLGVVLAISFYRLTILLHAGPAEAPAVAAARAGGPKAPAGEQLARLSAWRAPRGLATLSGSRPPWRSSPAPRPRPRPRAGRLPRPAR